MKQDEIKDLGIEKRNVIRRLNNLKKRGLIVKTEDNQWYFTVSGVKRRIFGESYGKALFDSIIEPIPLGTTEQKLLEFINRVGLVVVHICMTGTDFKMFGTELQQIIAKYDKEWINEAINGNYIFEWFNKEFNSEPSIANANKLKAIIGKNFTQHYTKLILASIEFNEKFFPKLRFTDPRYQDGYI